MEIEEAKIIKMEIVRQGEQNLKGYSRRRKNE